MAIHKKDRKRSQRRKERMHSRMRKTAAFPRVTVFRSLNNMYAQIVDDSEHTTITSCSTLELKDITGDKKTAAHKVGLELAKRAQEKNIQKVVFDRGSFRFHGRVKALAEGLREGGLQV